MDGIGPIMALAPVIPVLTIEDAAHAGPLAEALVAGGLPVIEVTLRTPAALDAIRRMRAVEGAIVGAGTVIDPEGLGRAADAGASFIVSPGLTEPLAQSALATGIPMLPGVATASDIMRAIDLGFGALKFFPAEASGGAAALKAFAGPFPHVRFCPTGGISEANAAAYLALPSVPCVGGTWIAPVDVVRRRDWAAVRDRASAASELACRATCDD